MQWLVTALGAAIVLFALRDMFHTIWHPSGQGSLSRVVIEAVWRGSRRLKRRSKQTSMVGPAALLAVILTWGLTIVAGWTLIYWPHMAEGFSLASGLEPSERADFIDSLYLSLVTVATLGYGDIVPTYAWLRLATPFQALIGFALLTAAVSWILQIYPALARRRALALRLAFLSESDAMRAVPTLDSSAGSTLLDSLAAELVRVRVDLTQYAETYYFREADARTSLPVQLPFALRLAQAAGASPREDTRLAADVLEKAVTDYAHLVTQQFSVTGEDVSAILQRYADDHGYRVP